MKKNELYIILPLCFLSGCVHFPTPEEMRFIRCDAYFNIEAQKYYTGSVKDYDFLMGISKFFRNRYNHDGEFEYDHYVAVYNFRAKELKNYGMSISAHEFMEECVDYYYDHSDYLLRKKAEDLQNGTYKSSDPIFDY